MRLETKDIDNINDRKRLVLLEIKENKSLMERYRMNGLAKKYANNEVYKEIIIQDLNDAGLLTSNANDPEQDENGYWKPLTTYDGKPYRRILKKEGQMALKHDLFPSENREKFWNKTLTRWFLLVGASFSFVSFLYSVINFLFKGSLDNFFKGLFSS